MYKPLQYAAQKPEQCMRTLSLHVSLNINSSIPDVMVRCPNARCRKMAFESTQRSVPCRIVAQRRSRVAKLLSLALLETSGSNPSIPSKARGK